MPNAPLRPLLLAGLILALSTRTALAQSSSPRATAPDTTAAADTLAPTPATSRETAGTTHGAAPGADKLQHASLALSIGVSLGIASRSVPLALGGTVALGTLKELRDRRHTRFDPWDLAADLAGATLAAVITRNLIR